jgi:hypothetical protein
MMIVPGLRVVITTLWAMGGKLMKNISRYTTHMNITGDNHIKSLYIGPVHLYGIYR